VIPTRHDMVVTKWGARFCGRRMPCSIGRGGISASKTEGDGVTPSGIWRIAGAGFRADRIAKPRRQSPPGFHMRAIGPHDIWSDDPTDPAYNHAVRAINHPFGHEKLRLRDPLYDIVLMSDWNWPDAVPGKGSAIFVHYWRRPRYPTAGCIAFSPRDLQWIVMRWQRQSRIFVQP